MKRNVTLMIGLTLIICTAPLFARMSIHDIQYTTNADGSSNYDGQVIDCDGGIVIHKWTRGRARIFLYDPNNPNGWGGIQSKDLDSIGLFDDVNLGDWVSLTNVLVEESSGTTFLQCEVANNPSLQVLSTNNPLPEPLWVDVADIAANYDPVYDECIVTDHRAEIYESMYIQVRTVTVADVNIGSHADNYSLTDNADPNIYCWASDYINADNPDTYTPMPYIQTGNSYCAVNGILEEYEKLTSGWDYFQLLTLSTDDHQETQPGDLDNDCDVDFDDLAILSNYWLVGRK